MILAPPRQALGERSPHEKRLDVDGIEILLSGREGDFYYEHIHHQIEESFFLVAALRNIDLHGRDVVDIGANIGLITLLMAQLQEGRVFAIEPSRTTFASLCDNVRLNGKDNIECCCLAIGAVKGRLSFIEVAGNSSSAHLTAPAAHDQHDVNQVDVDTFDNFCLQHGIAPGFIKIDVEGFEFDVLTGGRNTLDRASPYMFIELNSFTTIAYGRRNPVDIIDSLLERGGRLFWQKDGVLGEISKQNNAIAFLHSHLMHKSPINDLLYVPPGSEIDLAGLGNDLARMHASLSKPAAGPSIEALAVLKRELAEANFKIASIEKSRVWHWYSRLRRALARA